jgi:hypothetical protein
MRLGEKNVKWQRKGERQPKLLFCLLESYFLLVLHKRRLSFFHLSVGVDPSLEYVRVFFVMQCA